MPDFGIFRGFNEKLFGDKLYAGQLPINLGMVQADFFKGLLDLYPNAAAAYSLRKLRNAYTGSAIEVRRTNNDVADIGFTSTGELDTAALLAFTGTGALDNGFVTTWYDQSGNGYDATQTTAANQPQIVSGGSVITENGKPAVDFDGSTHQLVTTSAITLNQPTTQFGVGRINPSYSTSSNYTFASSDSGGRQHFFYRSTGQYAFFSGTVLQGTSGTSSVQFVFSALFNSPNSELYFNNSLIQSGGSGVQNFDANLMLGNQSINLPWYGKQQEFIFYGSDESSNRTSISDNINDFYSIY
jgi:hypothetical protein